MNEENRTLETAEESLASSPDLEARRAARRASQQRRRRNSVFQYIAILFMAAFVLLLYTFMMERRQSQQQIDDLKQSASAYQTLQGFMEENTQLKEQVQDLKRTRDSLESQLRELAQEQQDASEQLTAAQKSTEALAWFWELNDAYVRGRFSQCRELIVSMEEAGITEHLPAENTTGTEHLSPAARYEEIHNRVIK